MKAYKVTYSGSYYDKSQMYVIAENEDSVKNILKDKSSDEFDPESSECKIDLLEEVSVDQVSFADLSMAEFMLLDKVKSK